MAKKKKLTKAERKEARLRKGKQWLLTYTGSPKKRNRKLSANNPGDSANGKEKEADEG